MRVRKHYAGTCSHMHLPRRAWILKNQEAKWAQGKGPFSLSGQTGWRLSTAKGSIDAHAFPTTHKTHDRLSAFFFSIISYWGEMFLGILVWWVHRIKKKTQGTLY